MTLLGMKSCFSAWDGEEHSLLGSTEWVEQYATLLERRAVAYLNVDLISGNESMHAEANPILYQAAVIAAKRVPNPDPNEYAAGRKTVYDTWLRKMPSDAIPGVPRMPEPAGGSDHVPFFKYLGVPVIDFEYANVTSNSSYALYHTLYETPFVEEKILDPNNFAFHVATGQFWAEMTRLLADSNLLPMNIDDYATMLKIYLKDLNQTLSGLGLFSKSKDLQDDIGHLKKALDKMLERAEKFHHYADDVRRATNPSSYTLALDMFNSRLAQVERCFLNPRGGDPTRPDARHIVYGVGSEDSYASSRMPFIYDQIGKYLKAKSAEDKAKALKLLRQQISTLTYSVHCAISLLKKTPIKAI